MLRRHGFTLLEMSAVILIITILVSLLCAALNHTKTRALRVTCLDNMKQLQQAWWLYAADADESLPLNQTALTPTDPRFPQVESSKDSWVTGSPLEDISPDSLKRGTLYPYVNAVATYHCPMDTSTVPRHPDFLRTRSYAMNSYLGGDTDLAPEPKFKFGQIGRPENVFVFIEEHEASRWHSSFLVPPSLAKGKMSAASSAVWYSTPSDRHSQGCNISFADGHIEYWRWYAPKEPTGDSDIHVMSAPSVPETRDFIRLQSCLP
jgi:prepilin-type N-terminal cleavage/methylation domain-containing protein/prepilin-type processing-associated H-X9-DG protein